ncbi:MAG: translocation/assembly module TamB domain-containing protein [Armatimonadetes bacterium]|nr:translocation/assembly module TamB domain-containing protein [Armatimonadota bacterium]
MAAPVTVVTIAGGIYAYECLDTLLAPGTGFTMDYATPAGPLKIECEHYSVDLIQQTLFATKVSIKKEDGTLVAKVPSLTVKGLSVDSLAPKVQIKDGELWVSRLANGEIDLTKYFGPSEGGQSQQPWQISLRDTKVHFRDWTTVGGQKNDVTISSGNFVGQGDTSEGTANVEVDGLAKGVVTFHKKPGLVSITGKQLEANVASVLSRLRQGQEKKQLAPIEKLKVADGIVKGNFRFEVPEKGKTQFTANIDSDVLTPEWDKYRADRVHFAGIVTEQGLTGKVDVDYRGLKGQVDGTVAYDPKVSFGANVQVAGLTPAQIESFKVKIPKDVSFGSADVKGYVTYANDKIGWKGSATVNSPAAYGLKSTRMDVDVAVQGDDVLATLHPVSIGSTVVTGDFGYNLKTQAIKGAVSTPMASAKDFSKWLPAEVMGSKAQVAALIDGTVSKPNVMVKGMVDPHIKLADRKLDLSRADFALRFDGDVFHLDRLSLNDQVGSLYASGDIDLKKGMNVRVVGNGIDLGQLATDTEGKVDVQGQVLGTLDAPHYIGKMQAYGVGYSGVPGKIMAVATDFSGDKKNIRFKDIEAMKEASQITGSVGIGFDQQTLDGTFAVHGIDIRDLYDGPVGGVLDLKNVVLSGTIGSPLVQGNFEAKKVLAYNFAVDSAEGFVNYDGQNLHIMRGTADFAKGQLSDIAGDFSVKDKSGKLTGKFDKVDLGDVTESAMHPVKQSDGGSEQPDEAPLQLAVKGSTGGTFEVNVANGTFASFKSQGRVDDVHINKAFFGSGDWDASFDGKAWTSNAFIGSLDEYFRLDGATYVPDSQGIGGELLCYRIPIQDLLKAVEPRLGLSQDNLDKLHQFDGKLGAQMVFGGNFDNPTVDVPDLEVSNIKLGKEDLGNFSIKGRYQNRDISVRDGLLEGPKNNKVNIPFAGVVTLPDQLARPDGTAQLAGTIKDTGELDIAGSLYGFPVSKFSALAPTLSNVNVSVDEANFTLKGTKDRPILNSQVKVSAALTPNGQGMVGEKGSRLRTNTDITVQPVNGPDDGALKVDATGKFRLSSIAGTLDSHFYLNSDFGLAQKTPVDIRAKLDGDRDVSSFFKELEGVELGDDGVKLSGGFDIGNTFENPTVDGSLDLKAGTVRYGKSQDIIGRPLDLNLKDLSLSAMVENNPKFGYLLHLKARTTSNYSHTDPAIPDQGYLAFDGKLSIDDFVKLKPNDGSWKDRQIMDATLAVNKFGVFQSFPQGAYVQATVDVPDQPIKIGGTLGKPSISGAIEFEDTKTIIPTLNPTKGTATESVIDPTLDLKFSAKQPMNIKASLAEINAKGEGSVKGTLSNLKADGLLTVESGSLTLPGGNVKLSPDGTLKLQYASTGFDNSAKLDANLHGETSLTALKNGVTPERYDISIDVKGDLLSTTDSLQLTASSQPGDLSQDRILQLLGRTDILTNFLQSGVNSNVESELRNAFASYALPSLLNGITTKLAKDLGFDYFGVDYNAFEQTSVSFVKGLGKGFFLQGRQQLYQPLPGQPTAYDFRLAYRPRRGPNALRALSFSLGTDQLRPYKLSIDFTNRIATTKRPYQTIKLHVPSK